MTVRRVHHVQITIPTGAEEAGRAFYCGFLGLTEPWPIDLAYRWPDGRSSPCGFAGSASSVGQTSSPASCPSTS